MESNAVSTQLRSTHFLQAAAMKERMKWKVNKTVEHVLWGRQWWKSKIHGKSVGGTQFRGCGGMMGSSCHKPVQQCQNGGRKGSSEVNDMRLIVYLKSSIAGPETQTLCCVQDAVILQDNTNQQCPSREGPKEKDILILCLISHCSLLLITPSMHFRLL